MEKIKRVIDNIINYTGDIIVLIALLICIIALVLSVINFIKSKNTPQKQDIEYRSFYDSLIVDEDTNIVYIEFDHSICPYYSENGKLQKYENGKFIEIGE